MSTPPAEPEVIEGPPAILAESPVWDDRRARLWWVDIAAGRLHRLDIATGEDHAWPVGETLGAVAMCTDGDLLLATGLRVLRWTPAHPAGEAGRAGGRTVATLAKGDRANEAKCDPSGRLLVGTLVAETDAGGAVLYSLDRGETAPLLTDVTISNGIGWSPDAATMYYIDTPREVVDVFDYDVCTGRIGRRRVLVDLHDVPGRPDGLTVDNAGYLWVAMARGGAAVRRFAPDGTPDLVLPLPVPNVTSLAFAGQRLDTLCITTSRAGLRPADIERSPLSGRLFRAGIDGAYGVPADRYAG